MENQVNPLPTDSPLPKVKPFKNIKYGSVKCAIWKNLAKNGHVFFQVSGLTRCYFLGQNKENVGVYKETPILRLSDLYDAQLCLEEAYRVGKIESRRLFERENQKIAEEEEA